MRGCPPEFLQAFRAIARYNPDTRDPGARRTFLAFLNHRDEHPEFYSQFSSFIEEAADSGIHYLPLRTVVARAIWELTVVNRKLGEIISNNGVIDHYREIWVLEHPHIAFTFRTKGAVKARRYRNFTDTNDQ
jgi:hypothetical protein